jgi:hypothetical protein
MNVDVSSVVERARQRVAKLEMDLSTLEHQVAIARQDTVDAIREEQRQTQRKADEKFPYVLNLTQEQARDVLCIMGLDITVPKAAGRGNEDHIKHAMKVVSDSLFAQNGLKQYLRDRRAERTCLRIE